MASGLDYSIVRPTAFFKSLSGQVERLKQGKPFLVFGDGTLTACKPISDADLADYLAECLNPVTGLYDADATPSTGSDTLFDHYAALVRGDATHESGDHSVFRRGQIQSSSWRRASEYPG